MFHGPLAPAFSFLDSALKHAATVPVETRRCLWADALKETRESGTIFESERIGALLDVWRDQCPHTDSLLHRATDALREGHIRLHVLSHPAFSVYLTKLTVPLPTYRDAIEGHHQRPHLIFLRDPFSRSSLSRDESSLRLAANTLHEAIHLIGPSDPLVSELCAFAYDTALRVTYGDTEFFEAMSLRGQNTPHPFAFGLFTFIREAY